MGGVDSEWSHSMTYEHDTCAGTEHMDMAKRGRSWLGVD
jgi:hypothetical protein